MGAVELVAVAFAALLGLLGIVTRNPALRSETRALRAENKRLHALISRLHAEAVKAADVDPVAQVFRDEIEQAVPIPVEKGHR